MKGQKRIFLTGLFLFLVFWPLENWASDTGVGVRLEFMGGPLFSVVFENHFSPTVGVQISAGGFPGAVFRASAEICLTTPKRKGWLFSTGMGANRFLRGKGKGRTLFELHAGAGYRWTMKKVRLGLNGGLLYAPSVLNPWFKKIFKDKGDFIPVLPFVGIETLWNWR